MKSLKILSILLSLCFILSSAISEENHPLGKISGKAIDLKTHDHAIAGAIKNFVVWGFVNEETFSSELIMRKDAQIIEAVFKKSDEGKLGGVIRHTVGETEKTTEIIFAGIDKEKNLLLLKVNGKDTVVEIKAEKFDSGHFINPTYSTVYNNEPISFKMEGDACYGFSIHLVFLIIGAYIH